MPAKRRRLIFELSTKERNARLNRSLKTALERTAALNQPLVYRNELCTQPNFFIHQYPDGRQELIEQNQTNSAERTIRVIK